MEINWLGHSCFKIKGKQATVITDPYSPDTGYTLGKQSAAIVTVSHQHPGHSYTAGINGEPHPVTGPGEYEISNVLVIGLASFHDNEKGKIRGKNTIYLIEMDDITICHLGDLGHPLTDDQTEELGNVDILMLPVGGISTINTSTAAAIVRQIEPKIVLPMHYGTPLLKRELDPVEKFLKEIGTHDITPQPKLTITKNNLPLIMQVTLLEL
ncbi:MAG: MBL fold metallo-hydrolase [Dehalococcoidales bacterium]|nr:MBL fold metallo-hydrolase [Dehalococcoidales bacterium]